MRAGSGMAKLRRVPASLGLEHVQVREEVHPAIQGLAGNEAGRVQARREVHAATHTQRTPTRTHSKTGTGKASTAASLLGMAQKLQRLKGPEASYLACDLQGSVL